MKTKLLFAFVVLTTQFFYSQNLVAYYPFNGNTNDKSGNANNGTVNGAMLTIDRFGNANSAYYFDGISNYISITDNPNINIQTGESFSISFWVKHDAQNNAKYMISKYQGSFGEPSYAIGTGSAGDSYSWFELTPSNGIENRGNIDLNDGNWHNITTVFKSGESITIYTDGVLDISNSTTHTGSIINTRNLTIGSGSNLAQFYKGSIDDIKIYKKALSETEINNEVNGLVAYYPFNGNANDISGSENNGTVHGATLTADRFGNTNSAYHFNGIDNDITCLFPGPIGTSPRTISFWAKTSEIPYNTWDNAVISYGSNNAYGERFELSVNSRSRGLGIDINGAALTKDFDNSDNGWHYYTAVFVGGTNKTMYDVKLYADGYLLTNATYDNGNSSILNTASEQPIHIGSLFNTYRFFNGDIDEVKFYNKALTETEIKNEFKNLIAYYPFNGNANDESGNNLNGTVSGASLTMDRFNNPGSAYSFDGSDIITVAHDELLNSSNELSISVWVKPNIQQDAMILGKSNYTTATNYLLRTKSTGFIQFEYKDFANSSSLPLMVSQWNHIAVISQSDNSKQVYINGVLASHSTATSPYGLVNNDLTIGARSGGENFQGSIDDLWIYKSALTESDVLSLYNNNTLAVSRYEFPINIDLFVTNNTLYISNDQDISEIKNISIYNILAQAVYRSTEIQNELNLNFLDQGVYVLKVQLDNGKVETKKFLIQ